MCESNVYLKVNGMEELIMENAAKVEIKDDNVEIYGLLGEKKEVNGMIKTIDFLEHKVLIEK